MKQYQTKLEEEKVLLEKELLQIGRVNKNGQWEVTRDDVDDETADKIDTADNMEEVETRDAILNELKKRLQNINNALLRIEEGGFGICEVGGDKHEIEQDRLDANPSATTCKEHMN